MAADTITYPEMRPGSPPEALQLTDYLVGPFQHDGDNDQPAPEEYAGLQAWQVPFYSVALNALRAQAGHDRLPPDWMPDPAAGAELYRSLATERKTQRMMTGIKTYIHGYKDGTISTELRDDQQEVFEDLGDAIVWDGMSRDITAKAATGIGKTVIITKLMEAMKMHEQPAEPVRGLVLVPLKSLIPQTLEAFRTFSPGIDVGVYYDEEKNLRPVTVMTYQSFIRAVERGTLTRDMVDVIVKDEEHMSAGDKTSLCLDRIIHDQDGARRKLVVGLSATPRDAENLATDKGLLEMIDRNILSPISARHIETAATVKEQKRFRKREDYTPEELADLVDNSPRNDLIIQEVLSGLASGRRVMVRCLPGGELLHPNMINERLRNITTTIVDPYTRAVSRRPIRSIVINGGMPLKKRELLSKAYNNHLLDGSDGLDVLLFVDTLTQGFDSHIAKKMINACPIRFESDWIAEQLLGRITRPFRRMDGSLVYGEAVDLEDITKDGQVLFSDILNKYAPEGTRYNPGAIVGPGLRDLREGKGQPKGRYPAFIPLTPDEIQARAEARAAQEALQEAAERLLAVLEVGKPAVRSAVAKTPAKKPKRQPGETDEISDLLNVRTSEDSVSIEASRKSSPFDDAEAHDSAPGGYISLEDVASDAGVSAEDIEDAILDRGTRLAVVREQDAEPTYYLSSTAWSRLRTYIADNF